MSSIVIHDYIQRNFIADAESHDNTSSLPIIFLELTNDVTSLEHMNSTCDYGQQYASDYIDIWRELFVENFIYNPNKSKSSYLKDLVLRYIQKFLAFNFFWTEGYV